MKYALKFTPGSEVETTMWVWFQTHGIYYVTDRDGIVKTGSPDFIDNSLDPAASEEVERVSFDDVPDHVHGYDPREIVHKLPRNYPEK